MWAPVSEAFFESLERAAMNTARVATGLLALVLLVALALALAFAARAAVGRLLSRIGFDRRVRRWAIAGDEDWLPSGSPTAFAARASFWAVLATGAFTALEAFEPTSAFGARALAYVPRVLAAAVLITAGIAAARYFQQVVLIGAVNLEIRAARPLGVAARWLILLTAVALALEHLEIGGRILPICFGALFGGVALAVALSVGLGSRDAVSRAWERHEKHDARRGTNPSDEVRHL